jgi:hypothetical protein
MVPKTTYFSDMEALINNSDFSDVIFIVEGKEIHANRAILAVRS